MFSKLIDIIYSAAVGDTRNQKKIRVDILCGLVIWQKSILKSRLSHENSWSFAVLQALDTRVETAILKMPIAFFFFNTFCSYLVEALSQKVRSFQKVDIVRLVQKKAWVLWKAKTYQSHNE